MKRLLDTAHIVFGKTKFIKRFKNEEDANRWTALCWKLEKTQKEGIQK